MARPTRAFADLQKGGFVPIRSLFVCQHTQVPPAKALRPFNARARQQRGRHVQQAHHVFHNVASLEAGPRYDQRDMDRRVMTRAFILRLTPPRQKMAAVIRRVDKDSVFPHSLLFERINQTSNVVIQAVTAPQIIGIIFRQLLTSVPVHSS